MKTVKQLKENVVSLDAHKKKLIDREEARRLQDKQDEIGRSQRPTPTGGLKYNHSVGTRLSPAEGQRAPWSSIRPGTYRIEKHVAHSDGQARVPMYLVRRTHDENGEAVTPHPAHAHKELHHLSDKLIQMHFDVHGPKAV